MAEEQEDLEPLRLVAGVFMNPNTQQMEIHAGAEGIDPIRVFRDSVARYDAIMALREQQQIIQRTPAMLLRSKG